MSVKPCKDCGQPVSTTAAKCPHCGRPQRQRLGCLLQTILWSGGAILLLWWFSTGWQEQSNVLLTDMQNKVAADVVQQYRIAAQQGDRIQICVQAGVVAAAFLQAQDSARYEEWKAQEKKDCRRAGLPR